VCELSRVGGRRPPERHGLGVGRLLLDVGRQPLDAAPDARLVDDVLPLSDVDERFANRQRIRTGFGFRKTVAWRFAAIYMWTGSRETIGEEFATNENILNFQIKRVW
jgi:hypothetical protein